METGNAVNHSQHKRRLKIPVKVKETGEEARETENFWGGKNNWVCVES